MRTGRPSRYEPEFARQARTYCRLGADIADLANSFSVSVATLYRWQHRHRDFALACVIGMAEAEGIAAPGLYRRAVGYEYRAERCYRANTDRPIAADRSRRVLADPKAAFRWLRNRRPETWGNQAHRPKPLLPE